MAYALKGQSHENIMIFEVYRMKKKIGAMPGTLFHFFSYKTEQYIKLFILELFSCCMFFLSWILNSRVWANDFFLLGRGRGAGRKSNRRCLSATRHTND
jgi:hypothetical protein